jgi:hypothetical protein
MACASRESNITSRSMSGSKNIKTPLSNLIAERRQEKGRWIWHPAAFFFVASGY